MRLCGVHLLKAVASSVMIAVPARAEPCIAPLPPFVPIAAEVARDHADIIKRDFEIYIQGIQSYFRCLEEERARAFEEARVVSEDYGRLLKLLEE